MNSNRPPKSKLSIFASKLTSLDVSEAKEQATIQTSDESNGSSPYIDYAKSKEFNEQIEHFVTSAHACAESPIRILMAHLGVLDKANQHIQADIILRELQGVKEHFQDGFDKRVVEIVMSQVIKHANRIMTTYYNANSQSYPSASFENIKVLKDFFPNVEEAFRYRPLDEKKEQRSSNSP